MTRWHKLKDWPASLARMKVEELRTELAYWKARERERGHRQKKKDAMNHARIVERLLDERLEQYRKEHGAYPASLTDLAPKYPPAAQLPDTTHAPKGALHYWREHGGYELMFNYSGFGSVDCTYSAGPPAQRDTAPRRHLVERDALSSDGARSATRNGWRCVGYF